MEITQGNKALVALIDDACSALEEVTRWPDSEIAQQEADKAINLLKKGWRDQSYPRTFLFFAMLHIAHNVHGATFGERKERGLRAAWMKIGELFDVKKDSGLRAAWMKIGQLLDKE